MSTDTLTLPINQPSWGGAERLWRRRWGHARIARSGSEVDPSVSMGKVPKRVLRKELCVLPNSEASG